MSTKKEVLGKENRKEKGHRRYSLLLFALLFIGFASYGTYAYFTSSTSTQHGHLTLNGMSQDYNIGGNTDGKTDTKTGDGTTNIDTDNKNEYNPDPDGNGQGDGNGKFEEVVNKAGTSQDEAHNSTQFGEFDWVYVGNTATDLEVDGLLTGSFGLTKFNKYITTTDHQVFGNVVGGDVFRKTVRLKVEGTATVPVTSTLSWFADGTDKTVNNLTGAVFVKRGETNKINTFDNTGFDKAINVNSPADYTNENISVKPGQYLDIEIVVQVNNSAKPDTSKDKTNINLATIAHQLKVTLNQDVTQGANNNLFGTKTASTTSSAAQAN